MASLNKFDMLDASVKAAANLVLEPGSLDSVGVAWTPVWETDKETLKGEIKGSIVLMKNKKYAFVQARVGIKHKRDSAVVHPSARGLFLLLTPRHSSHFGKRVTHTTLACTFAGCMILMSRVCRRQTTSRQS